MRQFYLETDPDNLPRPGDTVLLDRDESHHLFTVLRGGRESGLDLVDGRGHRLTGRVADLDSGRDGKRDSKRARVEVLTCETDAEESREPRLVLACAVVKGKRFEWALEKAVELGAHDVVPLETEFGVVDPRPGKQDRWRTIMTSALKQSGRSWLPVLTGPMSLAKVLGLRPDDPVLYGAIPADDEASVEEVPFWTTLLEGEFARSPRTLTMLIGPEGGWSPGELSLLAGRSALPVGLGPHVLRTETAAAAGLTVLQALRNQFPVDR